MTTRLPGSRYKDVLDRGRSVKGRLLVSYRLESAGSGRRAGVVVSKRTFHDAVDRNRAKRLVREAYRLLAKDGTMPDGVEWVFIVRVAMGGKTCGEVMREMSWCVRH